MTTAAGDTLQMNYDALRRLSSVSSGLYTKRYVYKILSGSRTSNLVSGVGYTGLPTVLAFGYTYDKLGNIATYTTADGEVITYTYDTLGQLLSAVGDQTYTYTYDSVGNLLTANGHTYTYDNSNWKDLLTAFDGEAITYDASGNPLSYYNGTRWTFTWENGRSLATATDGTTSLSYAYDADGLRTGKTVGGVTHNYFYAGGQLLRETYGSNVLDFSYDANGYPYALKYNGTTYYYITNLQGDVMYLLDGTGATVAAYEYDPYGNIISATGEMAEVNPLRYRGYYYEAELGMYYLQSRYYDPTTGRFINADDISLLGMRDTMQSFNLFAYCENNPILYADGSGNIPVCVLYAVAGAALFGGVTYLIGRLIGISGKELAILTGALAAVGAVAAAILGVKFLAKVAPKLAAWFNKVAKGTKLLPPNISKDGQRKLSLGGIVILDAFKLMLHPPGGGHDFFHIQIEVKIPGIGKNWIVLGRIPINPTKWFN